MAFAGLWAEWRDPRPGATDRPTCGPAPSSPPPPGRTWTASTTGCPSSWPATPSNGGSTRPAPTGDELRALLRPLPAGTLVHHVVDQRVGNVRNDDPGLVAPLRPRVARRPPRRLRRRLRRRLPPCHHPPRHPRRRPPRRPSSAETGHGDGGRHGERCRDRDGHLRPAPVPRGRPAAGAGVLVGASALTRPRSAATVRRAAAVTPAGSDLGAVEHVVFLMHENRSFDHYFGTYPGVRGFDDHPPLGRCLLPVVPGQHHRHPDRATASLPSRHRHRRPSAPTTSPTAGRRSTSAGTAGRWTASSRSTPPRSTRDPRRRAHDGLLHPGRSALLLRPRRRLHDLRQLPLLGHGADPPQPADGPVRDHRPRRRRRRPGPDHQQLADGPVSVDWPTMPEVLEDAGVSWKVYNAPGDIDQPTNTSWSASISTTSCSTSTSTSIRRRPSTRRPSARSIPTTSPPTSPGTPCPRSAGSPRRTASTSTRPRPRRSASGSPTRSSDASSRTPRSGPRPSSSSCTTRTTASSTTCPRRAPAGTPGEYLTVSPLPDAAQAVAGPIGLGFRVPMLVVSPFSRGGYVCSETFDHTSQLRFLETRFGSRRRTSRTGGADGRRPDRHPPPRPGGPRHPYLPSTSRDSVATVTALGCEDGDLTETRSDQPPYPLPAVQTMPTQEPAVT